MCVHSCLCSLIVLMFFAFTCKNTQCNFLYPLHKIVYMYPSPTLWNLLNCGNRNLIDTFSVISALNTDLKGCLFNINKTESIETEVVYTNSAKRVRHKSPDNVHVIEDILKYHPKCGYLIKWENHQQSTWNKTKDMPVENTWIRDRMRFLRNTHKVIKH